MKKAFYTLVFLASALLCHAQALTISDVRRQMQGTWLTHGDSICELVITADSITTFRFRQGGVSRCIYKLSTQPCDKAMAFPATTGIYITLVYKNTTVCCALSEFNASSFKIIYSNGAHLTFLNEAALKKNK